MTSPERPVPAHACPLCGGANDCALARSGCFDTPCWCRAAAFDGTLLDRVPAALRGKACICAACVARTRVEPSGSPSG